MINDSDTSAEKIKWWERLIHFLKPDIISYYILKEQLPPILVGLLFFSFVLIVNKVVILLSLLIEKGVSIWYSLELFLLMIPFTMALTVPVAVLMGTVMSMGRLSSDSEIIAMRASGISYFRIYRSLMVMGVFYTLVMIFFNNYMLPYANHRYRILHDEISRSEPVSLVDEGVFNVIPGRNDTLYARKINKETGEMLDVMIVRNSKSRASGNGDSKTREVIIAQRGKWLSPEAASNLRKLRLFSGEIHLTEKGKKRYTTVVFHDSFMDINFFEKGIGYTGVNRDKRKEREKSMEEIYRDLKKFEKKNANKKSRKIQQEIVYRKLEFWKHLTIPFANLALTLIGAPLGIVSHRSGKGMGFGFAIIVSFVYYVLLMFGERSVNALQMKPWIGAWLPVLVVSLIGLLLIYFRNSAESMMEAVSEIINRLSRSLRGKNSNSVNPHS